MKTCQGVWRSAVPDAYRPGDRPSVLFARRRTSGERLPTRFGVALHEPTTALVDRLALRDDVDAILLRGSVALGVYDDASDDDLEVVVGGSVDPPDERRLALVWPGAGKGGIVCDAFLTSVDELAARAHSALDVIRWPYRQARILHVRDPAVLEPLERVASMPAGYRAARMRHGLVDIALASERGRRCERRGQDAERVILVVRGARALARVIFALEWQWVPLDHWFTFGLSRLSDPSDCAGLCRDALATTSVEPLVEAASRLREHLRIVEASTGWGHDELLSAIRRPERGRERAVHGLC